jgi:hypothetical protein
MPADDDYGTFREQNSNILVVLNQLADELLQAELEVEETEQLLKEKKAFRDDIATVRIPAATDGLEGKFDLGNDRTLEVKEEIRASVAGEKLAPAVEWLDQNDYGSIVKRTLVFEFGKDDDEKVRKFKESIAPIIRDQRLVMKEKTAIHPQTLLAWVKERLKEGDNLPIETFGIFRQKTAKVK